MDEEKNGFILAECFWLLIEGALWGYFAYVCYKYDDTYYPKEDEAAEEEPKKEEEKKEEEKKEEWTHIIIDKHNKSYFIFKLIHISRKCKLVNFNW